MRQRRGSIRSRLWSAPQYWTAAVGRAARRWRGLSLGGRGWGDLGNLPGGGGNKAHLLCTRDMGEGQCLQVNQGGQAGGTAGKGADKTTGLERRGNFPVVSGKEASQRDIGKGPTPLQSWPDGKRGPARISRPRPGVMPRTAPFSLPKGDPAAAWSLRPETDLSQGSSGSPYHKTQPRPGWASESRASAAFSVNRRR